MALGANLIKAGRRRMAAKMATYLGRRGCTSQPMKIGQQRIFAKAGAPSNDTADDSPEAANTFIINVTDGDVYFCHTWASSTSFTVVKVTA